MPSEAAIRARLSGAAANTPKQVVPAAEAYRISKRDDAKGVKGVKDVLNVHDVRDVRDVRDVNYEATNIARTPQKYGLSLGEKVNNL